MKTDFWAGTGIGIATMAAPIAFPQMPDWLVTLLFWGGLALFLSCVIIGLKRWLVKRNDVVPIKIQNCLIDCTNFVQTGDNASVELEGNEVYAKNFLRAGDNLSGKIKNNKHAPNSEGPLSGKRK